MRSAASPAGSSPSELPLEIAFLLDFGVPKIVLQQGARLACRHGVCADEALLAEGLVDEEVFYRALAERLGLRFLSREIDIEQGSDFRLCAERGYARLAGEGGGWICAPQGAAARSILGAARTAQARQSLAITTRANFLDALARATLDAVAREAPFCAERAAPNLCARRAAQNASLPLAVAASLATALALLFSRNGALALAAALPLAILFSAAAYARGTLLAVYDAEDLPETKQLRRAAALFAHAPQNLARLQASLSIDNGAVNRFTAFFALEYAGLFEVFNKGLAALDLPIFLGGTSNHFRMEILHAVGFWDAYNVTEDADLGLRLARAGYSVRTFRSYTREEAPEIFAALLAQRGRWLKGWMRLEICA